ncbi:MAG: hypothetical protein NTZ72_14260 [Afipia sp.]|nr:hypothetical protein [Afipia sp.]
MFSKLSGSVIAWWGSVIGTRLSQPSFNASAAIVAMSFVISFAMLGPLLSSKIALVDESDIPQYLGVTGNVKFTQIPSIVLNQTEIGNFGKSQRYRPFNYAMRVTETALWGSEGAYWYGFRIFLFGIVIAGLWWLYARIAGVIISCVVLAFTLSFKMWSDIWARSTGPSEQYAAVGFVLFAVGALLFISRWQDRRSLRSAAFLLAAGGAIAMGSKENMLFLELPLAAALTAGLVSRRLDVLSLIALTLSLLAGAVIALSITVYFSTMKVEDIYGNSVGSRIFNSKWMIIAYCSTAVVICTTWLTDKAIRRHFGEAKQIEYRAISRKFLIWYVVLILVFVFQVIFYTGQMPGGGRYDFPGSLVLPALLLLLYVSLLEFEGLFGTNGKARFTLGSLLAFGLLTYLPYSHWSMPVAVAANVERNNAFDMNLRQTKQRAGEKPDWPIVVASFYPWDYEVVQSLGIIFVAKGVANPRFLVHVVNPDGEPRTKFETKSLDDPLEIQSRQGIASRGYLPIHGFLTMAKTGCFLIALRKTDRLDLDLKNGVLPSYLRDCERLPMYLYWEKNNFVFGQAR